MSDGFSPVRGKCTWWRERAVEEDTYDVRLEKGERRVYCSCFVEGKSWTFTTDEVPSDCTDSKHCRYYIKSW